MLVLVLLVARTERLTFDLGHHWGHSMQGIQWKGFIWTYWDPLIPLKTETTSF